jgi:hypothetical protein
MGRAVESVAVAYVRGRVPEFESRFDALLADEGFWELGSIQTFSELASWLSAFDDPAVRARTLAAVEFVRCRDNC